MDAHQKETTGVRTIARCISQWRRQIGPLATICGERIHPIGTFVDGGNDRFLWHRYKDVLQFFDRDLTIDRVVLQNFRLAQVTVDLALQRRTENISQ